MEEKMLKSEKGAAERWVGFRPEIRVLDCTVRDGGLMNDHNFDDDLVRGVYEACVEAGVDYMEVGYKGSKEIFPPDRYGPWKHCDEETLRRVLGDNPTHLKISVMADAERTDYEKDILPCEESVIDIIRVATYIHQMPTALDMIQDAHEKGYETSLNLMALSVVPESELEEALEMVAASEAQIVTVVDSFGAFYAEQVDALVKRYLRHAEPRGKEVAMHAHNNQQLAYANTVQAIISGANILDASFAGLGRGAGNCPMELLIGFLHNPKFKLRPVLKCIQERIEPMRESLRWGFDIPYMLTGLLNQHPRAAIQFNGGEHRGDIVRFFDEIED